MKKLFFTLLIALAGLSCGVKKDPIPLNSWPSGETTSSSPTPTPGKTK